LISYKNIDSLKEAFEIRPKEIISLVGAGGKTTLMFALSRELTDHKKVVITTTTTKIFPPSSSETPFLLLSREEKEIVDFILKNRSEFDHITIASEKLVASNKLQGINPELVKRLSQLRPVTYVIVEADGAARRPLKAPNPEFEPVIPLSSTLVIPVVGIDALGCRLSEDNVFRSEIASKLTELPLGETVTADTIVNLILHPSGIMRGIPDRARIIPFINKIDLHADLSEARDIASKILEANHFQINQVVLGQAQLNPPVVEVVFKR
jgi:probable selenium-dependent hydroxylase accessory protein YqeC